MKGQISINLNPIKKLKFFKDHLFEELNTSKGIAIISAIQVTTLRTEVNGEREIEANSIIISLWFKDSIRPDIKLKDLDVCLDYDNKGEYFIKLNY